MHVAGCFCSQGCMIHICVMEHEVTVNSCVPGYGRQCLMNFADAHAAFVT